MQWSCLLQHMISAVALLSTITVIAAEREIQHFNLRFVPGVWVMPLQPAVGVCGVGELCQHVDMIIYKNSARFPLACSVFERCTLGGDVELKFSDENATQLETGIFAPTHSHVSFYTGATSVRPNCTRDYPSDDADRVTSLEDPYCHKYEMTSDPDKKRQQAEDNPQAQTVLLKSTLPLYQLQLPSTKKKIKRSPEPDKSVDLLNDGHDSTNANDNSTSQEATVADSSILYRPLISLKGYHYYRKLMANPSKVLYGSRGNTTNASGFVISTKSSDVPDVIMTIIPEADAGECLITVQPVLAKITGLVDIDFREPGYNILTMQIDVRRNIVILPTLAGAYHDYFSTSFTLYLTHHMFGVRTSLGQTIGVPESRNFNYSSVIIWFSSESCVSQTLLHYKSGNAQVNTIYSHDMGRPSTEIPLLGDYYHYTFAEGYNENKLGTCPVEPIKMKEIKRPVQTVTPVPDAEPDPKAKSALNLDKFVPDHDRRPLIYAMAGFIIGIFLGELIGAVLLYVFRKPLYGEYYDTMAETEEESSSKQDSTVENGATEAGTETEGHDPGVTALANIVQNKKQKKENVDTSDMRSSVVSKERSLQTEATVNHQAVNASGESIHTKDPPANNKKPTPKSEIKVQSVEEEDESKMKAPPKKDKKKGPVPKKIIPDAEDGESDHLGSAKSGGY